MDIKIGILYIGIGKYIQFWNTFYSTCETNFLQGFKKTYFLYTDQEIEVKDNVKIIFQQDLGWPGNTLYRYNMFLQQKKLLEECNYLFFFNANTRFTQSISFNEFVPNEDDGYLVCLSWHIYNTMPIDKYPYERRVESNAFIPYNIGEHYFQGGLNGGRSIEFIKLIESCSKSIKTDTNKKIIACYHDESHLNKYLLGKKVKVISTEYGCPQEWINVKSPKIVFRNKDDILGCSFVNDLKGRGKIFTLKKRIKTFIKKMISIHYFHQ